MGSPSAKADRIACVVPHCRRTRARAQHEPEFREWMCGDHWRMVPQINRRAYGRHMRRWRRFRSIDDIPALNRLWFWIKRRATERALGL